MKNGKYFEYREGRGWLPVGMKSLFNKVNVKKVQETR